MKNFTIGTPCSESWDQMTNAEKGRFCDVCAKCVIDLTQKSTHEIAEIYEENHGDVCGRMTLDQLPAATQETSLLSWDGRNLKRIQRFAAAFALFFGLFIGKSIGQTAIPDVPPPTDTHSREIIMMGDIAPIDYPVDVNQETVRITGSVQGSKASINGLQVDLLNDGNQRLQVTYADKNGHFSFEHVPTNSRYKVEITAKRNHAPSRYILSEEIQGRKAFHVTISLATEPMIMGKIKYEPPTPSVVEIHEKPVSEPVIMDEVAEVTVVKSELLDREIICTVEREMLLGQVIVYETDLIEDSPPEILEIYPAINSETLSSETEISSGESSEISSELANGAKMLVSPNPGDGLFAVDIENWQSNSGEVLVTNIDGKIISSDFKDLRRPHFEIDLRGFSAGIYFLRLKNESQSVVKRLVIQ